MSRVLYDLNHASTLDDWFLEGDGRVSPECFRKVARGNAERLLGL